MEAILHQWRLVGYPIIYKVLYISTGAGFMNHQQYDSRSTWKTAVATSISIKFTPKNNKTQLPWKKHGNYIDYTMFV